jgi:hypothetical protein
LPGTTPRRETVWVFCLYGRGGRRRIIGLRGALKKPLLLCRPFQPFAAPAPPAPAAPLPTSAPPPFQSPAAPLPTSAPPLQKTKPLKIPESPQTPLKCFFLRAADVIITDGKAEKLFRAFSVII